MATINVKDANDQTVQIELPAVPGRAGAAASRPVTLSTEDYAALAPPRLGASQDLPFSNVSDASEPIIGTRVRLIAKGANCRIRIVDNTGSPAALADDTLLIAEHEYLFSCVSGQVVCAIRDASTSGTLNITTLVTAA